MSKRMLSGVKPTGRPHIGNYFGAMKQFVDMQNQDNEVFVFVANLHSLNSEYNPEELKENTMQLVLDYLAIGLDPNKVVLYLQSDIPAHTEANWIFNNLVTVPYLERCHAYKDAIANGREANMGLFDYPVLMAADILLYSPDFVPVGQDQKQHVEYARDIAGKFNFTYSKYLNNNKEILKLPEAKIVESMSIVPGIDGRKMSKSYKNHIPMFADEKEIREICSKVVTDSKRPEDKKNPDECNIYNIYKLIVSEEENLLMRKRYEDGGLGYKEAKDILAEAIINYFKPMRNKRLELSKDMSAVVDTLKIGAQKARKIADEKLKEMREVSGIVTTL